MMKRVPAMPATEAPAIIPVGVDDSGGVVFSIGVVVLGTPEAVLDVCGMWLSGW